MGGEVVTKIRWYPIFLGYRGDGVQVHASWGIGGVGWGGVWGGKRQKMSKKKVLRMGCGGIQNYSHIKNDPF